ncbi:MAG: 50S ribosomal protein L17 [Clostridiales bacterium]|jgi:large subunit ribosomal protein L17|nr:50S ribosomal protein L17 [Clostridiales bacterium]
MEQRKLGRPTDQRDALLTNQVTELLWHGKIETTYARAKEVSRMADKILTLAVNTYTDTVKKIETRKNKKGQDVKIELVNDGKDKLAARRRIMGKVYDPQEQRKADETKASFRGRTEHIKHPLIEKIFNELAPKYDKRNKQNGQGGGYTRVLKAGPRRGDNAEMAVIELV